MKKSEKKVVFLKNFVTLRLVCYLTENIDSHQVTLKTTLPFDSNIYLLKY